MLQLMPFFHLEPGYINAILVSGFYFKKSHTCEEGGAHLRISFWHLLINLKKQLFIKTTVEVD